MNTTTSYTTKPYTAADLAAMHAAKIQRLASNGRDWLKVEAAEVKAAMGRQGRAPSAWKDGTMASLESQLSDLRAAWKFAL